VFVGSVALPVIAADAVPAAATVQGDTNAAAKKAEAAIEKSLAYLKAQQQADGGWQKKAEPPAITALVLRTMLLSGKYTDQSPEIRKGFDKLLSYQLDNGGIFKDLQGTYNTAIAITALTAAKEYATTLQSAASGSRGTIKSAFAQAESCAALETTTG